MGFAHLSPEVQQQLVQEVLSRVHRPPNEITLWVVLASTATLLGVQFFCAWRKGRFGKGSGGGATGGERDPETALNEKSSLLG